MPNSPLALSPDLANRIAHGGHGAHRHSPELVPRGGRLIKKHEQCMARYRRAG